MKKKYIQRNVPYPQYENLKADAFIYAGRFCIEKQASYKMLQSECVGPDKCMQFWPPEENITHALQELKFSAPRRISELSAALRTGDYAISQLPREGTGMINFRCKVFSDSTLYVIYDETLGKNNTVNAHRLGCNACVKYILQKGEYILTSFEPVSMKYLCFLLVSGAVYIEDVKLVEYKHPPVCKSIDAKDAKLQLVYDAAVETFLQNAVDIFMDCPSRERAGWLCDSYFSGRTEHCITGNNQIEKNFLENFLMEENFQYLPKGMLPMCYPADHLDGVYIPNWAMWLVLELADYYSRTNDARLIMAFQQKILDLLDFLAGYENRFGLLERLDKWVFVDWSESNSNVQDVSFPTNMLYAYMLEQIADLYNNYTFRQKAEKIKAAVRRLSFNGKFFCDNLLITDHGYKKSGICTESCQYYAFFTGTATKQMYPDLWHTLIHAFGFERTKRNKYPDVPPANAFIGNYIRLELLCREKLYPQLLSEIKGYFTYMAQQTGTLWESVDGCASMNHGFASYVAVWIETALS